MPVNNLLKIGVQTLSNATDVPHLEAELLLSHIKRVRRETLLTSQIHFSKNEQSSYKKLLTKRLGGAPIAYLTGKKEFFGIPISVNKNVLIPRPETELLVETALQAVREKRNPKILEIGTGSGAIAIAILANLPKACVTATDIKKSALNIAKKNAFRGELKNKIIFIQSDLFSRVKKRKWDLVIANLPYLSEKEGVYLKGVTGEPASALIGGKNGYEVIERLILEMKNVSFKTLLLEIDPRISNYILKLIQKTLKPLNVKVIKDLAGWDRVIMVKR